MGCLTKIHWNFGLLLVTLSLATGSTFSTKELPLGKLFDDDDDGFSSSVLFDPLPAVGLDKHEHREIVSLMSVSEVHHTTSKSSPAVVLPLPSDSRPWWHGYIFSLFQSITCFMVLKVACMTSNLFFQVSPYSLVKKWITEESTGQADPAPIVAICFGCCQWNFYGTFAWYVTGKTGFLVIVYANAIGMFLGAFYVTSFQRHCKSVTALTKLHFYYKVISCLITVQIIAILLMPVTKALFFSGLVSSSCTIMGAVSPLTYVPLVYKSGSSAPLPRALVYSLFGSSVLWFSCGLILWDICLYGPNFASTCVASYLISLCWYYPNVEMALPQKVEKEGYEAKMEKLEPKSCEDVKLLPEEAPCTYGSTGETMDAPGGTF
jgi:hypothetical protein